MLACAKGRLCFFNNNYLHALKHYKEAIEILQQHKVNLKKIYVMANAFAYQAHKTWKDTRLIISDKEAYIKPNHDKEMKKHEKECKDHPKLLTYLVNAAIGAFDQPEIDPKSRKARVPSYEQYVHADFFHKGKQTLIYAEKEEEFTEALRLLDKSRTTKFNLEEIGFFIDARFMVIHSPDYKEEKITLATSVIKDCDTLIENHDLSTGYIFRGIAKKILHKYDEALEDIKTGIYFDLLESKSDCYFDLVSPEYRATFFDKLIHWLHMVRENNQQDHQKKYEELAIQRNSAKLFEFAISLDLTRFYHSRSLLFLAIIWMITKKIDTNADNTAILKKTCEAYVTAEIFLASILKQTQKSRAVKIYRQLLILPLKVNKKPIQQELSNFIDSEIKKFNLLFQELVRKINRKYSDHIYEDYLQVMTVFGELIQLNDPKLNSDAKLHQASQKFANLATEIKQHNFKKMDNELRDLMNHIKCEQPIDVKSWLELFPKFVTEMISAAATRATNPIRAKALIHVLKNDFGLPVEQRIAECDKRIQADEEERRAAEAKAILDKNYQFVLKQAIDEGLEKELKREKKHAEFLEKKLEEKKYAKQLKKIIRIQKLELKKADELKRQAEQTKVDLPIVDELKAFKASNPMPAIAKEALTRLAGAGIKRAYLVGGLVCKLFKPDFSNSTDIDIVIGAENPEDKIKEAFGNQCQIKFAYGTYQVTFKNVKLDIRPSAHLSDSKLSDKEALLKDAQHRDFTVNTLFADKDENVYDPTGKALSHLNKGLLKCIIKTSDSFAVDLIRAFRIINFIQKRKGFRITKPMEESIKGIDVSVYQKFTTEYPTQVNCWMRTLLINGFAADNFRYLFDLMLAKLIPDFHKILEQNPPIKQFIEAQLIDCDSRVKSGQKNNFNFIYATWIFAMAKFETSQNEKKEADIRSVFTMIKTRCKLFEINFSSPLSNEEGSFEFAKMQWDKHFSQQIKSQGNEYGRLWQPVFPVQRANVNGSMHRPNFNFP